MNRWMRVLVLMLAFAPGIRAEEPAPAPAATPGRVVTLDEAFERAVLRSETLAIRREAVNEAEAKIAGMRAGVKPILSARADLFRQRDIAGFDPEQREAALTLTQPLFHGFREFILIRAAKAGREAVVLDERRALDLLYADVAQAYLELLVRRKELDIRRQIEKSAAERIEDLRNREKIGRSRRSEVLAMEAYLAELEAARKGAEGDERAAREPLRFLTGLEEVFVPAELPDPALRETGPFLARCPYRADVEARRRDAEGARATARAARRDPWPSLDLGGNYYLHREGLSEDVDWDVTLSLEIPLYAGGAYRSKIRQAEARRGAAELGSHLALRQAEAEVRLAAERLAAGVAEWEAFRRAADLAGDNVSALLEEYRFGRATNQDVLAGLDKMLQTRLKRETVRAEALLAAARLEVAAGRAPASGAASWENPR
ncbi:MAG: TolC family protein [Planctomycetota bacterium]